MCEADRTWARSRSPTTTAAEVRESRDAPRPVLRMALPRQRPRTTDKSLEHASASTPGMHPAWQQTARRAGSPRAGCRSPHASRRLGGDGVACSTRSCAPRPDRPAHNRDGSLCVWRSRCGRMLPRLEAGASATAAFTFLCGHDSDRGESVCAWAHIGTRQTGGGPAQVRQERREPQMARCFPMSWDFLRIGAAPGSMYRYALGNLRSTGCGDDRGARCGPAARRQQPGKDASCPTPVNSR